MRILITGGTGLIGRRLCSSLLEHGHVLTVFSRHPETVKSLCGNAVNAMQSLDEYHVDTEFDAVINLAGEPIVDKRWTSARRRVLRDSRIALTERLMQKISAANFKPEVFLSGSAVGIYGSGGDQWFSEEAAVGKDFGAHLCADWEAAAARATEMGIRLCILRTGLVLDAAGGILKKMRLPFSLALGAQIGDGKQWMSWIHVQDYVAIVRYLLDDKNAAGSYNMVAPHPVTNREFTRTLAAALHRPALFVAPAFLLKLAMGEMAELLTGGQRVQPMHVAELGYEFQYPYLAEALHDLL